MITKNPVQHIPEWDKKRELNLHPRLCRQRQIIKALKMAEDLKSIDTVILSSNYKLAVFLRPPHKKMRKTIRTYLRRLKIIK